MASIFIADSMNHRLVVLDSDTLAYISTFGSLGSGND